MFKVEELLEPVVLEALIIGVNERTF